MHQSNGNPIFVVKRDLACDHLIHCNPQRINITLLIAVLSFGLFRRNVMDRSYGRGCDRIGIGRLCYSKIRDFYLTGI